MRVGKVLDTAFGFSGMGTAGKVGVGALLVGAGLKGFYNQVAPATIDAGMDVAFGDPQADRKVLGTDLTPSLLYGASGLPGAGYARTMNPSKYGLGGRGGPINNTARSAAVGGLFGGAAGTAIASNAAKDVSNSSFDVALLKFFLKLSFNLVLISFKAVFSWFFNSLVFTSKVKYFFGII
jgi:hypothetical protein